MISLPAGIVAVVFAVAVGMVFGLYPASASRLDPIEACGTSRPRPPMRRASTAAGPDVDFQRSPSRGPHPAGRHMQAPRYRDHLWFGSSEVDRFVVSGCVTRRPNAGLRSGDSSRCDGFLERTERLADLLRPPPRVPQDPRPATDPRTDLVCGMGSGWTQLVAIWLLGRTRNRHTISALDERRRIPILACGGTPPRPCCGWVRGNHCTTWANGIPTPSCAVWRPTPNSPRSTSIHGSFGSSAANADAARLLLIPRSRVPSYSWPSRPARGPPPRTPWFIRLILERIRRSGARRSGTWG